MRTNHKLFAAWGVASAALLVVAVMSFHGTQHAKTMANSREQTLVVMAKMNSLLIGIRDMELAARDFLLTAEPVFLEPYLGRVRALDADLDELQKLTADIPAQESRISTLRGLLKARIEALQMVPELYAADRRDAAIAAVVNTSGKGVTRTIEQVFSAMQFTEYAEFQQRDRHFEGDIAALLAASIAVGIMGLLITGLTGYGVRRQARDRIRILEDSTRYVERVIESLGEPLLVLDTNYRVEYANNAFYEQFPNVDRNCIGRLLFELNDNRFDLPVLRDALQQLAMRATAFTDLEIEQNVPQMGRLVLQLRGRHVIHPDEGKSLILLVLSNITQKKQSEEALLQSKLQFEDIIDGTSDLIQSINADGNFVFVNRAWRETMGYTEDDLKTMHFMETVHPDSREHCAAVFKQLISGESVPLIEVSFITKNGLRVDVEGSLSSKHVDGKLITTRAIFRNVTRRKQMEERVRASEYRFRQLAMTMPDGVLVLQNEKIVYANASMERMLKVESQGTLLGVEFSDIIVPSDTALYRERAAETIREQAASFESTFVQIQGGATKPVEISMSSLPWEGSPAIQIVARDISERKLAAEELALQKERLEMALTVAKLAMWDSDLSTGQTTLDEKWGEMMGISTVKLKTTREELFKLVPEQYQEELLMAANRVANGHAEEYSIEHPVQTSLGEWRWIYSRGKVVSHGKDGRPLRMIGTNWDITDRKEYEQNLVAAKEEAQQANTSKDMFLATMSHEIRTPLNGLLGMLELLSLSRLDERQKQSLETARDSGHSLVRIIDDVLDHAKIEAGMLKLLPEPVSIQEILRRTQSAYSAVASAKNLVLKESCDPEIAAALLADPLRLMQILGNFVSNAIKFTETGSVELRASLMKSSADRQTVRLSVIDTGIGIEESVQSTLFKPFEQATKETSRIYGGTGLGLTICRKLADMMGGEIEIDSTPGAGTTISMELTLDVVTGDPAFHPAETDVNRQFRGMQAAPLPEWSGRLVVAVDDHPTNRQLLAAQLSVLGVEVATATNGAEALALCADRAVDLIITDCNMPEMDGYSLARAVRARESHASEKRTPIIGWTANVLPDAAAKCHDAGMDDVLTKPASLTQLRDALTRWLLDPGPGQAGTASATGNVPDPRDDAPVDLSGLGGVAKLADKRNAILKGFMNQVESDLAELEAALERGDLPAAAALSHRMKGACRMVGARVLAESCERIELAALDGDGRKVAAERKAMHKAIKAVGKYIRDLVDGATERQDG